MGVAAVIAVAGVAAAAASKQAENCDDVGQSGTQADAPPLEAATIQQPAEDVAVEDGVTMFLSSFGGHPHEGLAARVQGICDSVGMQLLVVDFVESPQLRRGVLLQLRVFA